jgi:hypothetical protein
MARHGDALWGDRFAVCATAYEALHPDTRAGHAGAAGRCHPSVTPNHPLSHPSATRGGCLYAPMHWSCRAMATRSDHGAVIGTGITTGALVHTDTPPLTIPCRSFGEGLTEA